MAVKKTAGGSQSEGPATDSDNNPVVDPTDNVKSLQEASNKRQDDLRNSFEKLFESKVSFLKERDTMRAEHAREIRELETNRLNAIRQIDTQAVSAAATTAAAAIATLAATTTTNAENLRTALTNTASSIAAQTASSFAAITERIAALERSMYEGKGKEAVIDPQMTMLLAEVRNLSSGKSTSEGTAKGVGIAWQSLIGVVGLVSVIAGGIGYLATNQISGSSPSTSSSPPQIIYLPLPAPQSPIKDTNP